MENNIALNGLIYTIDTMPEKLCPWIGRNIIDFSNFITCNTFVDRVDGTSSCCCKLVNVYNTVTAKSDEWPNILHFLNQMSHYGSEGMETTTIGMYVLWNRPTYIQLTNNDTASIEWVLVIPTLTEEPTIEFQGPKSIIHGILTTNWAGGKN